MTEHGQDEILELLWTLREERKANRAEVLRSAAEPGPERLLEELAEGGMVDASGEEILLTKSGEDRARGIIPASPTRGGPSSEPVRPRQRTDGKQRLPVRTYPHRAVVESVCTFLGHPPPARTAARSREGIAATGSGPRSAPSSCV